MQKLQVNSVQTKAGNCYCWTRTRKWKNFEDWLVCHQLLVESFLINEILMTHNSGTNGQHCNYPSIYLSIYLRNVSVKLYFIDKQKVISKQRTKRRQSKSTTALAWLSTYAESYGEKLPNTAQIHLPPCSTKQHVFKTMLEETQNPLTISRSDFLRLWRKEASHIAIPKV